MTSQDIQLAPVLDHQCGYLAKSDGELLWAHHLATRRIALALAEFLPSVTEAEGRLLLAAALTHDIGKLTAQNQAILRGERSGVCQHKLTRQCYIESAGAPLIQAGFSRDEVERSWEILAVHHFATETDVCEATSARNALLSRMLISADRLASMATPDVTEILRIRQLHEDCLDLTYVEFGRCPGATAELAFDVIEQSYHTTGWCTLLSWANGLLLVGRPGTRLPMKADVVLAILGRVQTESIRLRPLRLTFTGNVLGGILADHPEVLLRARRSEILDGLATNSAPLYFLKLAYEILKVRKQLEGLLPHSVPLQLLHRANSTTGHPGAKQLFCEYYKSPASEKVNQDFFAAVFALETAAGVLAEAAAGSQHGTRPLRSLSSSDLFGILETLARPETSGVTPLDQAAGVSLHAMLSMEEADADFSGYAREQLRRYCAYKSEQRGGQGEGLCERCGSTATTEITSGDHFDIQITTQIKSRYGTVRAICPFCILDNLAAHPGNARHVVLAVDTRRAGVSATQDAELADFVVRMASGLRARSRFAIRESMGMLAGLAVPTRLRVPYVDAPTGTGEAAILPRGDRGMLVDLGAAAKNQSSTDLAVLYAPLYHLLRLMGLRCHMGVEEAMDLFGQRPEVSPDAYQVALATVLLGKCLIGHGKKSNAYAAAQEMLRRAPAVAVQIALGERQVGRGKSVPGLNKELAGVWIQATAQLRLDARNQGGMTMGQLFEDAAFLADPECGMPAFCEAPPGRSGWRARDISRHAAAKPVSQALSMLLQCHDTDLAKQKFRDHLQTQYLSVDIEATRLPEFLRRVDAMIDRYAQIRAQSTPEFLKTKNALTSAVYTFVRFPSLIPLAREKE